MASAATYSDDEPTPAPRKLQNGGKSHRKLQILTRAELDGRTTEAKQFDAIAQAIVADLGGVDQLSTVQKWFIEAFAGIALHVGDCNARLVLGEAVDIVGHSQAVNTMGRIGKQIGVERRAKPVMDLDTYLAAKAKAKIGAAAK